MFCGWRSKLEFILILLKIIIISFHLVILVLSTLQQNVHISVFIATIIGILRKNTIKPNWNTWLTCKYIDAQFLLKFQENLETCLTPEICCWRYFTWTILQIPWYKIYFNFVFLLVVKHLRTSFSVFFSINTVDWIIGNEKSTLQQT